MYFAFTKEFLQPLPFLMLAAGAALAYLWRAARVAAGARRGLAVLTAVYFLAVLVGTQAAVYMPLGWLEWPYPPLKVRPPAVAAIVVLSGGILGPDPVRLRAELAEDTVVRCLHAAELYHGGPPCPVIVTGGQLDPRSSVPPVATLMRDLLVRLGVAPADVVVEPRARTTFENAVESREILRRSGLIGRKVLLVTEAYHMARSLATFRKQGVDAIPAPCRHMATRTRRDARFFLPSGQGVKESETVLHEWLGLAWYKLTGRI